MDALDPRIKPDKTKTVQINLQPRIQPANWVREGLLSAITGYSVEAIRNKKKTGVWLENIHWRKAPDGRILYSPEAYNQWAES